MHEFMLYVDGVGIEITENKVHMLAIALQELYQGAIINLSRWNDGYDVFVPNNRYALWVPSGWMEQHYPDVQNGAVEVN